ncbi:MAG: CHAD domain-containing protein [Terracidiphilus sp.]
MNLRAKVDKPGAATLNERLAAWVELLARCESKPTRKRVHALRVATLRLQAELERNVSELPHASHQAQAMLQFGKQAEKLRRALGPVREIDVWIGKLRGLRASLGASGEYVPRSMQECLRGIDRLEDRLQRKRRTAERKLVAAIEKKGDRFVKAVEKLEAAPEEAGLADATGIANELVVHFGRVQAEFSVLDEANLHEFRKRIKTVRYLAEMHGGADRKCARIASQMKKLQGAIGEWHDWQALAYEAGHLHHAWSKLLAELLESLARETFETALETAHSVTARMLGEGAEGADSLRPADSKLPARGEHGLNAATEKKLA